MGLVYEFYENLQLSPFPRRVIYNIVVVPDEASGCLISGKEKCPHRTLSSSLQKQRKGKMSPSNFIVISTKPTTIEVEY